MTKLAHLVLPLATALAGATAIACSSSPPPEPAPPPVPQASVAPPVATPPPPAPTVVASATASVAPPPAPPANPCGEGMALIPNGEVSMGLTKKEREKKTPVNAFCIDVNETTAAAYETCVKGGKCTTTALTACDPYTYGKPNADKMPMVCVDFPQAEAFCKANDKRLPTAEEWEWAARGASPTASFPWGEGELADRVCWRKGAPCEIGSFPKGDSPQGVHDLIGGVFEWTKSKTDATTSNRFVRGASWKDFAPELFATGRQGVFKTTYRCGFGGIRCAKDAPAGASQTPPNSTPAK